MYKFVTTGILYKRGPENPWCYLFPTAVSLVTEGRSQQPGFPISLPSLTGKKGETSSYWNECRIQALHCAMDTISRYRAAPKRTLETHKIPDFSYFIQIHHDGMRTELCCSRTTYSSLLKKKKQPNKKLTGISKITLCLPTARLKYWEHFTFLLASPLMGTDIVSVRKFLTEFSVAIQIKTTNHKWGNCTENRIFALLRISSPLAAPGDSAGPPQYAPMLCIYLIEGVRIPVFFPLNPDLKLHRRKYIKDPSRDILGHGKPSNPPSLFYHSMVIQACLNPQSTHSQALPAGEKPNWANFS